MACMSAVVSGVLLCTCPVSLPEVEVDFMCICTYRSVQASEWGDWWGKKSDNIIKCTKQ
jgi:hypothetical protein